MRHLDPAALRRRAQIERKEQVSHLKSLIGTARCGPACRVVWEAQSCNLDPIRLVSELLVRHRNDLHQTLLQADFE